MDLEVRVYGKELNYPITRLAKISEAELEDILIKHFQEQDYGASNGTYKIKNVTVENIKNI